MAYIAMLFLLLILLLLGMYINIHLVWIDAECPLFNHLLVYIRIYPHYRGRKAQSPGEIGL